MRRTGLHLLLAASLCTAAAPLPAQSLADRVGRTRDGAVRFQYPAHPDVCGLDESIVRFHEGGHGYSFTNFRGSSGVRDLSADEMRARCRFGPAFVALELNGGQVERVRVRVGEPGSEPATDLGAVSAAEAVEFLLGSAARVVSRRSGDALFAATIADTDWAPAMLALATDRGVREETRRNAIFWTSQAAGEKAARGLHSILSDDSEELELRKHAVFALSQQRSDQAVTALLEVAEHSPEPEIRKAAFFWLGQKDEDPRVMALFQRVLLDR
ncbi:MAG TPA: HEAT repeat domain-containing protein [Longimicrobiales bacterium]|nr:HEAT repeat domain-containing protein [Longimicrobiales bacterium]